MFSLSHLPCAPWLVDKEKTGMEELGKLQARASQDWDSGCGWLGSLLAPSYHLGTKQPHFLPSFPAHLASPLQTKGPAVALTWCVLFLCCCPSIF